MCSVCLTLSFLYYFLTVTNIFGKERVEGVEISRVDQSWQPIPGTERLLSCDTLLLSVGLLPENEISRKAGVSLCHFSHGPLLMKISLLTLMGYMPVEMSLQFSI